MEPDPYSDDRKSIDQWVKGILVVFWPVLAYLGWRALVPLPDNIVFLGDSFDTIPVWLADDQAMLLAATWILPAFIIRTDQRLFFGLLICWPMMVASVLAILLTLKLGMGCHDDRPAYECLLTGSSLQHYFPGAETLDLALQFMQFWVATGLLVWGSNQVMRLVSPNAPPAVREQPSPWMFRGRRLRDRDNLSRSGDFDDGVGGGGDGRE